MVEDSGTFSVRAENAGGAAKSSANLVVEGEVYINRAKSIN